MRVHQSTLLSASALLAALLLGACQPQDPTSVKPILRAMESKPRDPLGPRYVATPEEGILLHRKGYPIFVQDVFGISDWENWGRWSDGDVVVIRFVEPLPRRTVVELDAGAYGGNIGKPIRILVGGSERQVVFKGGPFDGATTTRLTFENDLDSDTLVILLPAAVPASQDDTRRLGLAITAIRIKDGSTPRR